LRCCGGEAHPANEDAVTAYFGRHVTEEAHALGGLYLHDFPVTFRRVLRDDTMISMTSGDAAAWYAISLITYQRDLAPFLRLTRLLARTAARALGARPHWGKICPLQTDEIAALYPRLEQFRAHCASVDPSQVFVNDFARSALGFSRSEQSQHAS
jgi:L-gulonolactone oxidase